MTTVWMTGTSRVPMASKIRRPIPGQAKTTSLKSAAPKMNPSCRPGDIDDRRQDVLGRVPQDDRPLAQAAGAGRLNVGLAQRIRHRRPREPDDHGHGNERGGKGGQDCVPEEIEDLALAIQTVHAGHWQDAQQQAEEEYEQQPQPVDRGAGQGNRRRGDRPVDHRVLLDRGDDAAAEAEHGGDGEAYAGEDAAVDDTLEKDRRDRCIVGDRLAEIALHEVDEPLVVLDGKRLVPPQFRQQRFTCLLTGPRAEEIEGRVPRHHLHQQEPDYRDPEEDRDHRPQPPEDEPAHGRPPSIEMMRLPWSSTSTRADGGITIVVSICSMIVGPTSVVPAVSRVRSKVSTSIASSGSLK